MKASHLALGTLGAFVAYSLISKGAAKAQQIAKRPAGLNDYVDPYSLGLGCTESLAGCLAGTGCYEGMAGVGCDDGVGCLADADGLGFSLRHVLKQVTSPVVKQLKKVSAPVVKQLKKDVRRVAAPVVKNLKRDLSIVKKGVKRDMGVLTFQPLRKKGGGGGNASGAETVYQDENGNTISQAQYDAQMAQQVLPSPQPAEGSISYQDAPADDGLVDDAALLDQTAPIADDTQLPTGDGQGQPDYQDDALLQQIADQSSGDQGSDGEVYDAPQPVPGRHYARSAPAAPVDDAGEVDGDPSFYADEVAAPNDPDIAFVGTEVQGNTVDDPYAVRDDWSMGGLGALHDRRTGRPVVVARRRPGNRLEVTKLHADRHGNVFGYGGATLHRLGHVDGLAGAEGLGFSLFGRSFGQIRNKVVKVERKAHDVFDPVAIGYKKLSQNPTWYKRYRRADKAATPYLLIAGGTALSVATLGAGSAAGAVAIASGVAELGAQAYADKKKQDARHAYNEAGGDAGPQPQVDAAALQSAGESSVYGDTIPSGSGDLVPEDSSDGLLSIGEMFP